MAYALHRRAAFRQTAIGSGWNFDLNKSSYHISVTLMDKDVASPQGGSPHSFRRLFLPGDSSFILGLVEGGSDFRRYNFPVGNYGDLSYLQNGKYANSYRKSYLARPCAFSLDGLHFVRQGLSNNSSNEYFIYSFTLDSAFALDSVPLNADISANSALQEYTTNPLAHALAFSADGTLLLVLHNDSIRSYYLQTPFDVASASLTYTQVSLIRLVSLSTIGRIVSDPRHFYDWQFSPDGLTLVLLWSYNDYSETHLAALLVFKLSIPFNISTLSLDHSFDLSTDQIHGFAIDRAGQNLYIARSTTVIQYALSA